MAMMTLHVALCFSAPRGQLLVGDIGLCKASMLGGSWDFVTRVISQVTILIIPYSPN